MSTSNKIFIDYKLRNIFPPIYLFLPLGNQTINFDNEHLISNTLITDCILRIASGAFNHVSIGYGENKGNEERLLIRNEFRFDHLVQSLDSLEKALYDEINEKFPLWQKIVGEFQTHKLNEFYQKFFNEFGIERYKPIVLLFLNEFQSPKKLENLLATKNLKILIFLYGSEVKLIKHLEILKSYQPKLIANEDYFYHLFNKLEGLVRSEDIYLMPESFADDWELLRYWQDRDAPYRIEKFINYINSKSLDIWKKFMSNSEGDDLL